MHNDILDWGKRDMFLAALHDDIYIWNFETNDISLIYKVCSPITAACWDPTGCYISVGTKHGQVYIFDCNTKKVTFKKIFSGTEELEAITCLAWDSKLNQLACGRSDGCLVILDHKSQNPETFLLEAHQSDVIKCCFSPNGQYLVTSGADCFIKVWDTPYTTVLFQIIFSTPPRAITWHPWEGAQLAIGGGLTPLGSHDRYGGDGIVSIWDVSRIRNTCHMLPSVRCAVDTMAWSNLTGELVVSYWIEDNIEAESSFSESYYCRILVLSGIDQITDELCATKTRTRALLFNPDGTKLATASAEENLFIYDFLGGPSPLLNMYKRKIKKRNSILKMDEINEYNNFGYLTR